MLGPQVTLPPATRVVRGRLCPGLRTLPSFKDESRIISRGLEKGYIILCLPPSTFSYRCHQNKTVIKKWFTEHLHMHMVIRDTPLPGRVETMDISPFYR